MKPRFLVLLVMLLAGLAMSAPAYADDKAERIAASKQILDLTRSSATTEKIMSDVLKRYTDELVKENPGRTAVVSEILESIVISEFKRTMPGVNDAIAEIYARSFTLAELEQILTFYKTDIGKKLIDTMPTLLQQSMMLGQSWADVVLANVREKFLAALEQQGLKKPQGI